MRTLPFEVRDLASRPPASLRDSKVLAASTAETFTVPNGAMFAIFSATTDFWADESATAVVGIDSTDGSSAELNPAAWRVDNVLSISVISVAAGTVNISWYS